MRKITMALLLGSALVAGTTAVSSLYAQGNQGSSGSMMGHGMMGGSDGGGMMGMMKMMRQMSQMTDHCSNMMSDSRPNDQWRKHAPSAPDRKS